MRKLSANLFLLLFTAFLAINCSSKKNTVAQPVVSSDTVHKFVKSELGHLPVSRKDKFPFLKDSDAETKWVDSIYSRMTFSEKVGQLFMVSAYSNKDSAHVNSIDRLIRDYKIGSLIFFQGGPVRQARLTNRFQSKSKIPLFIAIDAEWGVSMRLDSTYRFPWNMTLGAIKDKSLIQKVGEQMGRESKRLGIHFNFAPVLDINTNPKNPIIGFRSFGEDKNNVSSSAIALMKGYQGQGVFSTGKHFPGHGDTEADSHYSLPVVNFSKERLNDVELYPYKQMFNEGLVSVMIAHLNVPALEPREAYPSSVSYNVVTDVLQKQMGFDGLIFTDALNMKAASNYRKPGEIDLEAFLAGNDMLLCAENVPTAYEKICVAYQDSIITEDRLAYSVKKILKFKYKAGLNKYKPVEMKNLSADINPAENVALQYQLFENAVTVLKNKNEILPIKNIENNKIAYVKLGDDVNSSFVNTLKKYTEVTEVAETNIDTLNLRLKEYNTVIVGFHKSDKAWKSHAFTETELLWLQQIAQNNNVILDVFTKPYSLLQIQNFNDIEGLIVSHQNADIAQEVSAEIIFGALSAKGQLPVTINDEFKVNHGLTTKKLDRIGFTAPQNVYMNPAILSGIDAVVQNAIDKKMTPGAQVLVARKGKVIYQKSFGYHTYENQVKVKNSDSYDVASLTKILATLPLVMQAYDTKKINLESTLGEMLPIFKNTDKSEITFKELLSHYARFEAWVPFYKSTLDKNKMPLEKYYRETPDNVFSKQVAECMYIRNDYHDSIMKAISTSKLLPKKEYKYSDFTFMILREYLEKTLHKSLDVLAYENLYKKIGANSTTFNPLQKFPASQIPPTEIDTYFRHQEIKGYVHDMAAAMEGGVAGHAGLFSNAMDVAKIMQLYLNKGTYNGHQFFSEKTFNDFNTCHFCAEGNRRALGFDKQQLPGTQGPTCGCVSSESFGHTGFTGTYAWADPETEIIYVFLSNRTFPDSNAPNALSKNNVRENIQKIIQQAIIK